MTADVDPDLKPTKLLKDESLSVDSPTNNMDIRQSIGEAHGATNSASVHVLEGGEHVAIRLPRHQLPLIFKIHASVIRRFWGG